jgi:anionic cell wall polymer biosynthesis LytR-Cps2A-Psr (LCP) family protein
VKVSKDTIGMIYDIDIDYYFRVNFEGFEEIIDSLGGVSVYSAYAFNVGNVQFDEGMNDLNGEEALRFARERYSLPGGDRQRGKNQMAVIQGVINKALSPEILKRYSDVLDAVGGNFETTVPYELIAELVRDQLEEGGSWDVITYSVDGTGDSQIPYSMSMYPYVMWPDEETVETAQLLIDAVENNKVITQP